MKSSIYLYITFSVTVYGKTKSYSYNCITSEVAPESEQFIFSFMRKYKLPWNTV